MMRPIDADTLIKELNNEDNQRILDGLACCNNGDMEAGFMYGLGAMEKLIGNQPTVNDWIPCSERMPEDDEDVLVSAHEMIYSAYRFENAWYSDYGNIPERDVAAWKPLPEPYKGGTSK